MLYGVNHNTVWSNMLKTQSTLSITQSNNELIMSHSGAAQLLISTDRRFHSFQCSAGWAGSNLEMSILLLNYSSDGPVSFHISVVVNPLTISTILYIPEMLSLSGLSTCV